MYCMYYNKSALPSVAHPTHPHPLRPACYTYLTDPIFPSWRHRSVHARSHAHAHTQAPIPSTEPPECHSMPETSTALRLLPARLEETSQTSDQLVREHPCADTHPHPPAPCLLCAGECSSRRIPSLLTPHSSPHHAK
jgi:hypothetical protein